MARKKNIAAGLDAVIYARYSSHNQREVSIEQQIAECTKHAAALGLRIVGTYEDRAISGKTDNRPRFQQMMRDAEKGKFQAVVAWKSNRIGRNMLQAMVNEAKLDDYGVKVFYAEEDFDDTAAGRFALRNMMNVNQFYSENMAEDITRGLYDNASKCMANGRQPLGYKRGENGRVVLDEANAAVVREIFTRVAAGDLFVDIARDLNAQGIKTSKGANWNKGSFQSICQNERYRGIYIYGDVRVADGIPRIVSDDLWYRVQEAMRMKKNPVGTRHRVGAEDYLLTGKLRCGHCGSYMTGVSGTSRNGELHYYYTCQKRRTEHACDKKNIRRDVIEPAVAQAIKMYCLTDDVIAWIADRTVEYWEKHDNDLQIEALEQQLEENKKATSNMLKAIEMGIITEATRTRMVELETEQSRLSVQLNAAKEDVVKIDREQIISYLELLQQGDIHDRDFQMELFKNFLVAVYVYDDNRMKLVFSCMGDQNSVEIPLETGEDPPDGGLSPDAKMFVLTPDSSTRRKSTARERAVFLLLPTKGETMSYAIVFSSKTGNTKLLADTLHACLPQENCCYFGTPDPAAMEADDLYVGFWTDKGNADESTLDFLKQLHGKSIFLFGTAGFGGSEEYFNKILKKVERSLDRSNTVFGRYMCQGKMPLSVRQRYEGMKKQPIHLPNLDALIENFDNALSHPDAEDLERLKQAVK